MQIERWAKKYWKYLLLGFLVLILFNPGLIGLGGVGYLTGTQGLAADFNSVRWNGAWWSNTEQGASIYGNVPPSSMAFGGNMVFDPDEATKGQPKLDASQQPILVRESVSPVPYTWSIKNSSVTLTNGSIMDVYHEFNMFKYSCDWRVNIWESGTEWEADGKYADHPDQFTNMHGDFAGAELWLKLIPQRFAYFTENPDQVYFAPAYVGLSEPVTWAGITTQGTTIMDDPDIKSREDLFPKATGETCQIFFQRGGGEVINDSTLLRYQGFELDPTIFRNEYWLRFSLLEFKAYSWVNTPDFWNHNWKYPSAYLVFQVDVFVVGQWTVMLKVGDVPTLEPHTPIMSNIPSWFGLLNGWFSNPFNQLWLFFIVAVIVVVSLSIFNPGLFSMMMLRRRKQE